MLLHRWFNYPPSNEAPFLTDKYGEKFWIYWDSINCLTVSHRGQLVGRVNLAFRERGEVILADIIIFRNRPARRNFRNRGLGKAMLQEAIRYAKERDAKFIWGWIEPDEFTTEEYLADWYRRQGFEVDSNLSVSLEL